MTNQTILSLPLIHTKSLKIATRVTHCTGTLPGSVRIVLIIDHNNKTKIMWQIIKKITSVTLFQLLRSINISITKQMQRQMIISEMMSRKPQGNLLLKNYYNIYFLYFKFLYKLTHTHAYMHIYIHTCIYIDIYIVYWIYFDYLDRQDSMLLFAIVSSHGECIGRVIC